MKLLKTFLSVVIFLALTDTAFAGGIYYASVTEVKSVPSQVTLGRNSNTYLILDANTYFNYQDVEAFRPNSYFKLEPDTALAFETGGDFTQECAIAFQVKRVSQRFSSSRIYLNISFVGSSLMRNVSLPAYPHIKNLRIVPKGRGANYRCFLNQ